MKQEDNWTRVSVDEMQFEKNQYFNITTEVRDIYEATKLELGGKFQYIFDLVVIDERKVFIVVIPTVDNIILYNAYLRTNGIAEDYIQDTFNSNIVYAMKLEFDVEYNLVGIEPDYVFEVSNDNLISDVNTLLPNIQCDFDGAWWIEGDGTIGYRATNVDVDTYAKSFPEYTVFHTLYPNLVLTRLFYLFKDNTLKFYYHCPYNEDHELGKAWFTKVILENGVPTIKKYVSYFNESHIENKGVTL